MARRQRRNRRVPVKTGRLHEVGKLRFVAARLGRSARLPGPNRAVGQRQVRVHQHQLRIELHAKAQPFTSRAGPVGTVEAEAARLKLLETRLAGRAGVQRAIEPLAPVSVGLVGGAVFAGSQEDRQDRAFAVRQRQPGRLRQPGFDARADHDPIHHGLDRMVLARRQIAHLVDIEHFAVDPHPHEPRFAHRGQHVLVGPLATADHRRQQDQLCSLGQRHQIGNDLLGRLLADGRVALVAGRLAQACEQQPQVIVDFRDRGHGAARVLAAGALVDRDRRLQAFDQVDVRAFQLVQELPGVDRQAFDVLPLPLGEQRVEGQRALARAAGAGDHDQAIAGQVDVDISQVVDPGAANADGFGRGLAIP